MIATCDECDAELGEGAVTHRALINDGRKSPYLPVGVIGLCGPCDADLLEWATRYATERGVPVARVGLVHDVHLQRPLQPDGKRHAIALTVRT